jgi:RNA polymerase sigma-70 factor (ECF subfamily)
MAAEASVILRPADDESALVVQAANGHNAAYAELIRRHETVAYRVAVAIAGSPSDAQEAVQNAYVSQR